MSGVQDLSGTVLKGYHLGDRLGGSSHTAVYAARRRGRPWTVKLFDSELEPGSALADRFRGEAAVLASAALPQVVPIWEAGRSGRMTFVASPYVRAPALSGLMGRDPLDNERVWTILSRLAGLLDAAHQRGLVCRSLRPGHILVLDREMRLAEFGLTSPRVGPRALSASTYRMSEPQYLSPEQVAGREPDRRSDIYALAVLVFELLTCSPLHGNGSPADILRATLEAPRPSAHERRPDLPRSIDRVLERALSPSPGDRHPSAGTLLEEMVALPEDASVHPVPAGPAAPRPSLPAPVKAPAPPGSRVAALSRMGVPVLRARNELMLNSYFSALARFAEEACGDRWPEVLSASGLAAYLATPPPDDTAHHAPVLAASRLADGIDAVFGLDAPEVLRQWGRLTADFWTRRTQRLQEGDVTYMKPLRLVPTSAQRVEDALYVFSRTMDRIRGEDLLAWRRVGKDRLLLVQYDNLTAIGRHRPARACDFWTATLGHTLRWGGCANDWVVDEDECGCVTGTFDCVFAIRRV